MNKKELLEIAKKVAAETVAPYKEAGQRSSELGKATTITLKEQPFSISKYLNGAMYGFPEETTIEKSRYIAVNKVLTEGVGAVGGFLVPPEYSSIIIDDLRTAAVVRAMGAMVVPMNSDTLRLWQS